MIDNLPYNIINQVPMTVWHGVGGAKLHLVHTMSEWRAFYELLMQQKLVACDTETTGFNWYKKDRICGMSFGWKDMHFYVPVRHKESIQESAPVVQLNMDEIRDDLIAFFSDSTRTTPFHNAKFDMHFFSQDGIEVNTQVQDTRILWHFYDENAPGALKTIASGWKDDLGRQHPGLVDGAANIKEKELSDWRTRESRFRRDRFRKIVMAKADELASDIAHQDKNRNALKKWIAENLFAAHPFANSGKEDIDYSYIPVGLMTEYAALDTFLTYRVYEFCVKNLKWTPALTALYKNEMSLLRVLFEAERHGVFIDVDYLRQAGVDFDNQSHELYQKIQASLGDINLQSTQQLAEALIKSGVFLTEETDNSTAENRRYALDKKVLEKLKGDHDSVKDILKLREITKLKNTYVDGILDKLGDSNILHCSFNQNVATGRMSSQNPNLQNIPARDKTIRNSFVIPSSDYIYILADYSQIEIRLTTHYSKDPLLLDAYAKDQDVHTRTMCEMFGYTYDEVNSVIKVNEDPTHKMYKEWNNLRRIAKTINFGIIYGVSAPGLSQQIPRPDKYLNALESEWIEVCQQFMNQYFAKYQGVKRFINQGNRLVAKEHQVVNYFGRVRHLPHANAVNLTGNEKLFWMEKRAQRQGVNSLVQGTAADLFKISVVRIFNILKGHKSKLVNFVHDEIHVYLHKDEIFLLPKIKHAMEDWKFSVPILAEFSYSTHSWAQKRSIPIEHGSFAFPAGVL